MTQETTIGYSNRKKYCTHLHVGHTLWFSVRQGADKNNVSAIEANIFWLSLIFTILLWVLLTITTLFSPTYIVRNIRFDRLNSLSFD